MKKFLLFFAATLMLYAQSVLNIHHNLNSGNWTTSPGVALSQKDSVKSITIQATGSGTREFLFNDGGTNWYKVWYTDSIPLNQIKDCYTEGSNTYNMKLVVADQKYYTFNANYSQYGVDFCVMETDAQPITITNVQISPSDTITNNQKATVNITLSGNKSPQERVYLRYTTDNWATSTAVDITNSVSGTSASFEFPYLPKNTTVKFYVLTSTKEELAADYDMFTLNYNTNSGNNYTITVIDNGSTTYNNPSLAAGTPVDVGFRVNEKLGTSNSTDYYVTWDAYNIYFAFTGGSLIDNDKYNVAIDVDPDGTNGTDLIFNGVNYTGMTQKIDYHIEVVKSSSLPVAKLFKNNAGSYEYVKNLPNYCDISNVKIKLPIADLTGATGVTAYNPQNPIQFVMFISNNNSKPFTMYPANTAANGNNDITATKAVKFANLASGVVPSSAQNESSLPVELVENSFKGQVVDNKVILTWSTASEINNKGFEVEKFVNNKWESVGFVNGAGNSNVTKHYRFEDVLTSNKLQYRLKQIDNDGKYSYSEVIEVNANIKLSYDLKQNYPNPFNPTTKITFELPVKAFAQIKVYNILGSEVATLINNVVEEGIHTIDFNAENLPAGIYFVTMKANGFAKTIKVNLLK